MSFTIRQWRRLKDLSQQTMAERCNVFINTYINWEKAPEKLTIEKGHIVAKALGVDFDDISFIPDTDKNEVEHETESTT